MEMDGGRDAREGTAQPAAIGLIEVLAVWMAFLVAMLGVFTTYARIAPEELYNVSEDGLRGGASRLLVYLNYPMAIATIALLAIATIALLAIVYERRRRCAGADRARRIDVIPALAVLAVGACAVIAWPGVVDQGDLDAKVINIVPAGGVAFVAGLTMLTAARRGIGRLEPWQREDRIRVAVSLILTLIAIPWCLAEFGVYSDEVPGLDRIYLSSELVPAGTTHAAVHLGDHHGTSGFLLALSAIWLSRVIGQMRPTRPRGALRGYLSLMLAYGLGNIANDAWLEQVVKRGWTDWRVPSVTEPALSAAWAVVLIGAVAFDLLLRRRAGNQATTLAGAAAG